MTQDLKRTPLFNRHKELGGKMVPFAGWEMPVQYSGVVLEHMAVRTKAGIFDVSHMGEVFVRGKEALEAVSYLTCNDISKIKDGQAQYNAITNEQGGIVDDIIVYKFSKENLLICVNASNADKDFNWFLDKNKFDAEFTNQSNKYGQIAVQGPRAFDVLAELVGSRVDSEIKYFYFKEMEIKGTSVICARTGYTGEDGFELFIPAGETTKIWDLLLDAGAKFELIPCGLGARDSLRLEACYPLYGHELRDDISAIESGLGWIVKLKKGEFIGRAPIEKHKEQGAPRSLVGFAVSDKGIVRDGALLFDQQGKEVGFVTSGTMTPFVGKAIGMAIVNSELKEPGTPLMAEVRGRRIACEVAPMPFYKRQQ